MRLKNWLLNSLMAMLGTSAALGVAVPAHADDAYPSHSIMLVVGFPPGGTTDLVARLIAQGLTTRLGQGVVVENRPGATGAIGSVYVASGPPDGYRLLMTAAGPHGTMPALAQKLPYDAIKDFTPIAAVCGGPNVVMVNKNVPAHSLKELLDLARAHPGSLNFGSTSPGSSPQMSGELLKKMAHVDMQHIPYQGGGPMMTALLGGQIQIGIDNLPSAMPQIRAGSVRALAVTTPQRFPTAPDIPTVAESGLPGYDVTSWYGVLGPKNLPAPIVQKLNAAINDVLNDPTIKKRMLELGATPYGGSPQRFAKLISTEINKWKDVVTANKLQLMQLPQ